MGWADKSVMNGDGNQTEIETMNIITDIDTALNLVDDLAEAKASLATMEEMPSNPRRETFKAILRTEIANLTEKVAAL